MYHEEKIENGKLYERGTPNGKWHEVSYSALLLRYLELKGNNEHLMNNLLESLGYTGK